MYPYKYRGMLFYSSIFDTPYKILLFGVYTFVLHSNFVSDAYLEKFIQQNRKYFVSINELDVNKNRRRSYLDKIIEKSIECIRNMRKS